jgi:hypothetical protein
MRTPTAALDNFPTDKLDPAIGSTREKHQDRNPAVNTEPTLTTSSISKFNRGEHSKSTKEKEHRDTKQADKDKESQEIPRHRPNHVANITCMEKSTHHKTKSTNQINRHIHRLDNYNDQHIGGPSDPPARIQRVP